MDKIPYFINKEFKCECYLQGMCLEVSKPYYDLYSSILIRSCERLEDYVNNNESFMKLTIDDQLAISISHYERRIK
jgi:hypothetical protein